MLEQKQEKILFSLLEEFISTAEPVGSKLLCQKYKLDCCPATVRNLMASLEEMGYLCQPYTSAGRIPSPQAFRYYINKLLKEKLPLPKELKEKIKFDRKIRELEELVEHAAELLANITRYTALILIPRARKRLFRYLSIQLIDPCTLLLVVLTNTGFVSNRLVRLSNPVEFEKIQQFTAILNEKLQGCSLSQAEDLILGEVLSEAEFLRLNREFFHTLSNEINAIEGGAANKVFLSGKDHLFELPEFQDLSTLKGLLSILEKEQCVAEILSQSPLGSGVQVKLGEELCFTEIKDCALITAPYYAGNEPLGSLGILGPLRMPYPQLIPLVNLIAESFSRKLSRLDD